MVGGEQAGNAGGDRGAWQPTDADDDDGAGLDHHCRARDLSRLPYV